MTYYSQVYGTDTTLVHNYAAVANIENENCQPYRFDWETSTVFDQYGRRLFQCSLEKITQLNIILSHGVSYSYVFDLDTFAILNTIKLPALKILTITGGNYWLNLQNWQLYEGLVENQSLEKIRIEGCPINDDWIEAFFDFKKINEIKTEQYVSLPSNAFPRLERLDMSNMYFFFSNSILELNDLKELPSLQNVRYMFNDLYPEVTYFCNELSPEILGHPFYEINKTINEKLKNIPNYTGLMIITGADVGAYTEASRSDTLARGFASNGQPVGVWDFKLPDFQNFIYFSYYYDYSNTPKHEYPKNGSWTYFYPDGEIAISGHFQDGRKHGEWKFFNPNGELTNVKTFVKGEPNGLFTSYRRSVGEFVEFRLYVFSPRLILGATKMEGGSYRVWNVYNPYYPGNKYSLNSYGQLNRFKKGKFIKEVSRDSCRYNRILVSYLRKLYPDQKVGLKEVSFEN